MLFDTETYIERHLKKIAAKYGGTLVKIDGRWYVDLPIDSSGNMPTKK